MVPSDPHKMSLFVCVVELHLTKKLETSFDFGDQLRAVMILKVQFIDGVDILHIRLKSFSSFAFYIKNWHKIKVVYLIHNECVTAIYFILV